MYKVWSIEDIKLIINEISEKWNYPCDIKIEVISFKIYDNIVRKVFFSYYYVCRKRKTFL